MLKVKRKQLVLSLLNKWPGKERFGVYRYLPGFFILGGVLEFAMIHWHVGDVNFYKTLKKKIVEQQAERELQMEEREIRLQKLIEENRELLKRHDL